MPVEVFVHLVFFDLLDYSIARYSQFFYTHEASLTNFGRGLEMATLAPQERVQQRTLGEASCVRQ